MTLKSYLWGMRISTALSFLAWVLVLRQIDPENSGIVGQAFFYLTSMLFLSGIFILFFTWLRRRFAGGDELAFAYLSVSFRQGILLAVMAVLLLILQGFRILTWWDGLLVVAGVCLVELYFLTRR